ncbi:MAG: isopenicillin N synthase family dioxygenase [Lysobacter sp.]
MSQTRIPTFDIRRFEDPAQRDSFVAELGTAYQEWGFAGVRGHGIPEAQVARSYDVFQRFFALPEAVKRKYHIAGGGGARGYTPFGIETAKGATYSDLKEFWHVGREIPRDSRYAASMPANCWPEEIPEFREVAYGMYESLDRLGAKVLSALALHIDLPVDWFDDKIDSGNSILRPLHYPPITSPEVPNERAGAHEDINLITLLVGASAEGLEVLSRQGEWVPFTADADTIVVNIGDMLQRLTNHVYPSTTHRVVNPKGDKARQPRYSTPFFLHPNPDFVIDVLPATITVDNPSRYPEPITAQGYLEERLREIKLK